MPISIQNKPSDALTPAEFANQGDITHIECGDAVRLLDSGKVQCLKCLKTGYPHAV